MGKSTKLILLGQGDPYWSHLEYVQMGRGHDDDQINVEQ